MKSIIVAAGLLFLAMGCTTQSGGKSDAALDKETKVELDELKQMILEQNWDALDLAEKIGAPAMAPLADLLKNSNAEIRQIALNCVALTGDKKAIEVIASALRDPDEDVRSTAMQTLEARCDSTIQAQLVDNLSNPDPDIRGAVALMLGNLGDRTAVAPIRTRLESETDPLASRRMKLSLAKLGDEKLMHEFADQLSIADSHTRYQGIEDLAYIDTRALAGDLFPALLDRGEAFNIGDKDSPVYGRVCDAAINLLGKWFNEPFSFEINEYRKYTDEEIEEVRKFLQSTGHQK
ncbi:MAG: HEAT repeat domain-containing protein [Methanosarcinaceae archaeon]|nr:HEAT repeat domain-containing protein [Methanosarcinaceae archaeon]